MKEEFRSADVPGYLVSNTGKVFSTKTNKFMKQTPNQDGYPMVALRDSSDNQRLHRVLVHRLVAFAFVHGYVDGLEVDYKDQNKTNNNHSNLRWVDRFSQQRNTPNNIYIEYEGESHILKDICSKFNSPTLYGNVLSRVNRGKGTHQTVFETSIKGLRYGS